MNNNATLGWDIGGAHLKAVLVRQDGHALHAVQRACPLWQGIDHLEQAVRHILAEFEVPPTRHAVTMTGELADIFVDRKSGVEQLTQSMVTWLSGGELAVYAGRDGFVAPDRVSQHADAIASANWYASADFLASGGSPAIFIDIGSTTTDIIALSQSKPIAQGYSDAQRLQTEELVYTGVIRTPIMAVAQRLPFSGNWQRLAAEHFATMADVYRLTGELPEAHDMAATADGQGKTSTESARRLARMIGCDLEDADMHQWQQLAFAVRSQQLHMLQCALERQISRLSTINNAPFIGAGAGVFLVRELARIMNRPFIEAKSLVKGETAMAAWAEVCLPAYAVAWLRNREAPCL